MESKIRIPIGFRETIVTPKTSRNVEAFWSFVAAKPGRSLVLPDGRCDVIFRHSLSRPNSQIPIVTGPATRAYMVQYEAGDSWFGMRLRPNHGASIWGDHISIVADTVLRGDKAARMLHGLQPLVGSQIEACDLSGLLALGAQTKSDERLEYALDCLHASGGRLSVAQLAEMVGCTPRHLNRIFRNNIGLGTKSYSQLVQFHRALKLIQHQHLSASAAAYEGGYSDHAHLSRAFRRFGGFTPSTIPRELSTPTLFA